MEFQYLLTEEQESVIKITLNRPELHNAFNPEMIQELTRVFDYINNKDNLRIVILTGSGKSFSAGADLNYMKKSKEFSYDKNIDDAKDLENMFNTMYKCPKAIIGKINGAAFGGGLGLIAVCDIAIAINKAKFGFSEVNLGIMPAVISPYVIPKIGFTNASRYFITGDRFTASEAKIIGLINDTADEYDHLDIKINDLIKSLLSSSPQAISSIKTLLKKNRYLEFEKLRAYCIEGIAKIRTSDEGKEGLSAFLEKRKPSWNIEE